MFGIVPFFDTSRDLDDRHQARKDLYDFMNASPWNFDITYAPSVMKSDVKETDTEYDVKCDLPGVDKSDISVEFTPEHVLTISYEKSDKKDEGDEKEKGYVVHERSYASMKRSFSLPDGDKDDIHASYTDGVLNVKVGKVADAKPVENKQVTID